MTDDEQMWANKVAYTPDEPWTSRTWRCVGCDRASRPCRVGIIEEWRDGAGLRARARLSHEHEGGPGVAHGGFIASMLDEILGHIPWSQGHFAVTKSLCVDYLRPVPIDTALELHATAQRDGNGAWHAQGMLVLAAGQTPLARGRGVWVEREIEHYRRFRQWLATTSDSAEREAEPTAQERP
jgi:uncharacterized protein (TIGR00369 family)